MSLASPAPADPVAAAALLAELDSLSRSELAHAASERTRARPLRPQSNDDASRSFLPPGAGAAGAGPRSGVAGDRRSRAMHRPERTPRHVAVGVDGGDAFGRNRKRWFTAGPTTVTASLPSQHPIAARSPARINFRPRGTKMATSVSVVPKPRRSSARVTGCATASAGRRGSRRARGRPARSAVAGPRSGRPARPGRTARPAAASTIAAVRLSFQGRLRWRLRRGGRRGRSRDPSAVGRQSRENTRS